jgi:hypothetical protein
MSGKAKFESSIGSTKFTGVPIKEFDISDETKLKEAGIDLGALNRSLGLDQEQYNPAPPQERQAQFNRHQAEQQYNERFYQQDMDIEDSFKKARELRKNPNKERLSESARKRIETLIGMSRSTREADIEGNVYKFQSLSSKESREVWNAVAPFDGKVEFAFEMRRQVLSRSLVKIGIMTLEEFVGSSAFEDKLLFLDELPESLLLRLNAEYSLLVQESQEKYAVKTEEDAQSVVEDLKK